MRGAFGPFQTIVPPVAARISASAAAFSSCRDMDILILHNQRHSILAQTCDSVFEDLSQAVREREQSQPFASALLFHPFETVKRLREQSAQVLTEAHDSPWGS